MPATFFTARHRCLLSGVEEQGTVGVEEQGTGQLSMPDSACACIVKRVPVSVSLAQERSVNPWFPRSPIGV
jgi:hypothetical protein